LAREVIGGSSGPQHHHPNSRRSARIENPRLCFTPLQQPTNIQRGPATTFPATPEQPKATRKPPARSLTKGEGRYVRKRNRRGRSGGEQIARVAVKRTQARRDQPRRGQAPRSPTARDRSRQPQATTRAPRNSRSPSPNRSPRAPARNTRNPGNRNPTN